MSPYLICGKHPNRQSISRVYNFHQILGTNMKFSTAPSAAMAGLLLTLGYISPAVAQVSISVILVIAWC